MFDKFRDLKLENALLKKELESAKEIIRSADESIGGSSMYVDFKEMNAFSIERNISKNKHVTIIGYIAENKIHEWSYFVTLSSMNVLQQNLKII